MIELLNYVPPEGSIGAALLCCIKGLAVICCCWAFLYALVRIIHLIARLAEDRYD